MRTPTEAELESGPCPTIQQPYRAIRTTMRGRLSARADPLGTLQLHLQTNSPFGSPVKLISAWRSGPLRRCDAIMGALKRSLVFLGEEPTTDEALRLSRRIDSRLSDRLTNFVLMNDGQYQLLADQVCFGDEAAALRGMPLSGSWVAAKVEGDAAPGGLAEYRDGERPVRETFMLVRRSRIWELWMRTEEVDAGCLPCRHNAWMCSVDLLHEEPQFAAELLLYALFRRQQRCASTLSECSVGLISPERLDMLRKIPPPAGNLPGHP